MESQGDCGPLHDSIEIMVTVNTTAIMIKNPYFGFILFFNVKTP